MEIMLSSANCGPDRRSVEIMLSSANSGPDRRSVWRECSLVLTVALTGGHCGDNAL